MLHSDWLESFIVFARLKNFTHAAQALHISQPALHTQIAKLASACGVELYRKVGRNIELTTQGIELAAMAREMRDHQAEVLSRIQGEDTNVAVTLAAGRGAYLNLLGPALKPFIKAHPGRLSLLTTDAALTLDAVQSGKAHLGVTAWVGTHDKLCFTPIHRVGQMLVMPKNHHLANAKKVTLQQLEGEELIFGPSGGAHQQMVVQALESLNVPYRCALETNDWDLMLKFAQLGLGLAIVNDFCSLPRGLTSVPVPALPAIDYCLVEREKSLLLPLAQELRSYIFNLKKV